MSPRFSCQLLFILMASLALLACQSPPVTVEPALSESNTQIRANVYNPPDLPRGYCDPEEPPPPLPAENGECAVEILILDSIVTEGQGISENGNGYEAAVTVDASGNTIRIPEKDFQVYRKDAKVLHRKSVGVWTVPENGVRRVEVCTEFREDDRGGANGDDDVGNVCRMVTLRCPEAGRTFNMGADLCMGGDCSKLNGAMSATFEIIRADADGDDIPNEQDWAPELCDEQTIGQHGRASLIHFHYGDGPAVNFAQTLGTNVGKSMVGYDYVILLIDPSSSGPFQLTTTTAHRRADVIMEPTEDNFFLAMQDITARGYNMDVYIHSHGFPGDDESGMFEATADDPAEEAANVDGEQPDITGTELVERTEPDLIGLGRGRVPVLMNYSVSCQHSYMNDSWLDIGTYVSSGAREINFYPNYYGKFMNAWNRGDSYVDSVAHSQTLTSRIASQLYVEQEGSDYHLANPATGCASAPTGASTSVLDQNSCAETFFLGRYGLASLPYDPDLTGAANMNDSSVRLILGFQNVRKNSPVSWYP